jgi:flagellar protein FliO/FliZ
MIGEYLLRLFLLLPMIGGLAWGSLWLWRRVQLGLPMKSETDRPVRIVDVVTLGANGKLAVVEFRGREILVGISRSGICAIAEGRSEGDA